MSLTGLYQDWKLVQAPFKCRQDILKQIRLIFTEKERMSACDTANSTGRDYTLKI